MRELTIMNIGGTNAIGKSTRMKVLIDYMIEKFGITPFSYDITKGKDPKIIHKEVGFTSNGYLFIGSFTKSNGWVGWDNADFSSWGKRIALFKDIYENYKDIHTIIVEGYFNNRSAQCSPNAFRLGVGPGVISANYVFLYNSIDEYIARTNGRTGKDRGLDWAEKSSGWLDNVVFERMAKVYISENQGKDKTVILSKDEVKDYFVQELFGEKFEQPSKENKNQEVEKQEVKTSGAEVLEDW